MNKPWMQLCQWCWNRSPERNWCHVCNGAGVTNPPLTDVKINEPLTGPGDKAGSGGGSGCDGSA